MSANGKVFDVTTALQGAGAKGAGPTLFGTTINRKQLNRGNEVLLPMEEGFQPE